MNKELLLKEVFLKAIRSSGPGGQHVNKVSSKIELTFHLEDSKALNEEEKERIGIKLKSRLTKENVLMMQCATSRSQHKNKAIILDRFLELLIQALRVPKKRKPSKPTRASVQKRLDKKKKQASKKNLRNKPNLD